MKRTIYLHGYLKDLHPEPIKVEATTIAEALRVLEQIPELKPEHGPGHPVRIDGVLTDIQLFANNDTLDEIHIRPQVGGAGGRGGLTQILLGVVLIGVSLALGPAGTAIMGTWITNSTLMMAGAGLVLGGLLQMMLPKPEALGEEEKSQYLPPTTNTVAVGTPIPMVFGARLVGGQILSLDSDAKLVTSDTSAGTPSVPQLPQGSTAEETRAYHARYGLGEFASGAWGYETFKIAASAQDTLFRLVISNALNISARGYTPTVEPFELLTLLRGAQGPRGLPIKYQTRFTVPTSGVYAFKNDSTYPVKVLIDGVEAATHNLTAGTLVSIEVVVLFGYELQTDQIFNLQYRIAAGAWAPITNLVGAGDPFPPGEVNVRDSLFVEYDKTPLSDGLSPIRPVFASPVASPSNVPTSEWRP